MKRENTILIVDDDANVRATLEALLFKENYELIFAANGIEALARLNELEPDVILLDVMMPDMDGFELCRKLKTDERRQHIPIILITALDSKQGLADGFGAGADDFIAKPVSGLELRARVRSMLRLKTQFDQLQATLRLRDDLASMVVHDMNNPLNTIMGFSDMLLLANHVTPEGVEIVNMVRNEVRRLIGFTHDILMMAKMEEGKPVLNYSSVGINQLVGQVEESHNIIAHLNRIHLATDLPPEEKRFLLDANLIRRVLDNLVSNAIKFSPSNGTVTLKVDCPEIEPGSQPPGPRLRIQVKDEGPGIPKEERDRIFDKFEVVEMKENSVTQVGLGLAFCKMAVEAHQGRIFVAENEPAGTILTVEI